MCQVNALRKRRPSLNVLLFPPTWGGAHSGLWNARSSHRGVARGSPTPEIRAAAAGTPHEHSPQPAGPSIKATNYIVIASSRILPERSRGF